MENAVIYDPASIIQVFFFAHLTRHYYRNCSLSKFPIINLQEKRLNNFFPSGGQETKFINLQNRNNSGFLNNVSD